MTPTRPMYLITFERGRVGSHCDQGPLILDANGIDDLHHALHDHVRPLLLSTHSGVNVWQRADGTFAGMVLAGEHVVGRFTVQPLPVGSVR